MVASKEELLILISKIEHLTEDDYHIDKEIALAIGYRQLEDYGASTGHWVSPENWKNKQIWESWVSTPCLPQFTLSVTDAFLIVPETWTGRNTFPFVSKIQIDKWQAGVGVAGPQRRATVAYAPTAALAVCLAALKARVEILQEG